MAPRSQRFANLEEPQKRGQATESIIATEFVLRDIPVLTPLHDNYPYDFVIEHGDDLHRLQAKTAYKYGDGTVRFETVSTRLKTDGHDRSDYIGKSDYFVVYNPVLDEVYLLPVDEAPVGGMEIRYIAPKNNQTTGINWHEDFLLDEVLGSGL